MSRRTVVLMLPAVVALCVMAAASIAALVMDSEDRRERNLDWTRNELETRFRQIIETDSTALRRSLDALLRSRWGDELMLALEGRGTDQPAVRDFCPVWIEVLGLDTMLLIDASGRILSSGHLPAEVGQNTDLNEAKEDGMGPVFREVTFRKQGKLERAKAWMVSATRKWQDSEVVLWGGKLLSNSVCEWQKLLGATLELKNEDGQKVAGGCDSDGSAAIEQDVVVWEFRLPHGAYRLTAGVQKAEAGIARGAILVEAAGAVLALLVLLLGKKFL